MASIGTFRRWIAENAQLGDEIWERFAGVAFGVVADATAAAFGVVLRMPWLLDEECPDDVVPLIGAERRMPRYPGESVAAYKKRLFQAWEWYERGGDEDTITAQLAAAGYPGAVVLTPWDTTIEPPGYWSHFIVTLPPGSHPVTAVAPVWGSFNWGDGTTYGPVGLSAAQGAVLRAIVRKWKPVDWICRRLDFDIDGVNTASIGG